MTNPIRIFTHSGVCHADDVFATAMLHMIFPNPHVVRTRDPDELKAAAGAPDTFLLDIGGQYDPEQRLFDHHQPEGAGFRRPDLREWPFATAGLIWKHYGDAVVRSLVPMLSTEEIAEIAKYIDDSVIKYIDAVDCGFRVKTAGPSLSGLIASFNPAWYEAEEDEAFPLVLSLARVLLTNLIKRFAGKVLARLTVRKSVAIHEGRVLVLDTCLPWTEVVAAEMPDVMFVVYPVSNGIQWQLKAAVNQDMTQRIKLPQAWAGRERAIFARISGEPQSVFCHRSCHLAGALTKAGAISLALKALAIRDDEVRLAA